MWSFIQALLISTVSSLCVDISSLTTRDKYLQNNLFGTTSTVNVMDCAAACHSYQQCQSFGFEPRTRSCHLHGQRSNNAQAHLISRASWIHGTVNELPKTLWGLCADHSCPRGQKCHVNRRTNGQVCVTANLLLPYNLCPVTHLTNAVLSTGGQEIGASRTYTCQDDFMDIESFRTSVLATCLPDNSWSPLNLTCSGPYVKREIISDSSYIFHSIETGVLNRITGSTSSLIFLVKTCRDCNFLLHANVDYSTGEMYEVAIGGYRNTKSVIVKGLQGTTKFIYNEADLLSCTEFRPFWISWNNSIITVGKGSTVGGQEFLRWTPDPPMAVNFVSYSSHVNNPGIWYFLVQS